MTIKEVMKLGTRGMSAEQKQQEQERRVKVVERINVLGGKINGGKAALAQCEKGSEAAKKLNSQIKGWKRDMNRIKADENCWLKEAAWFMYA